MSEIYNGDVLEHALNFGIKASADRYNIPEKDVYDIVRKFKDEIDLPCPCEEAGQRRITAMCFICTKQSRINF